MSKLKYKILHEIHTTKEKLKGDISYAEGIYGRLQAHEALGWIQASAGCAVRRLEEIEAMLKEGEL